MYYVINHRDALFEKNKTIIPVNVDVIGVSSGAILSVGILSLFSIIKIKKVTAIEKAMIIGIPSIHIKLTDFVTFLANPAVLTSFVL